jgi:secreted trypsin-like serine protease
MRNFFVLLILTCAQVWAQDPVPTLIGGTPADPAKWPYVVWLKMSGSMCTGTVVGDRAVITAAHCVSTGGSANFTIGNKTYRAVFTRHPKYPGEDWDVSIGKTEEKIDVTPVSISGSVAVGDTVHLMGYGCIKQGGGGGNDGILREGDAKVTQIATYDLVTKANVALCYGDSGGPAFFLKDGNISQVGINSKGNISDTSYDTKLWADSVTTFLKNWSTTNSVGICGLTQNCNGVEPPPPPPLKEFTAENSIVKVQTSIKTDMDIEYVKNVIGDALRYLETGKP